ncbi:sulfatase-like hydrolase/transferase [Flammeovirga sp. SJP92]|uniref:sulfatase-like hydrolase/transferase n=1 Tax=Flammeovirga sp. SJP92 TaxID=1775430 RepID=UPI000788A67E|nr:sulfatase-like hydrolase/transferase [Flammeovirga sp. SJP92]KXX69292.1 arylsulfatase [Flammeovirga sp. SJP92]
MKKICKIVILLALWAGKAAGQQPNVVLIYTDDHRYSGIHALGGQAVETPNMDKLSEEGVVFDNAYLMGSFAGATCIPSRAMLLSGRPLFQLKRQGHLIPKEHTTISEAFHSAGYRTHIVGKWHQDKASVSRAFDSGGQVMGLGAYLVDHYRMPLWKWNDQGKYPKSEAYLISYDKKNNRVKEAFVATERVRGPIGTEENGPHTSEIFAEDAIDFIENYKEQNPFFMYLAFHAPHDPRQAPKRFKKKYPEEKIQLPPSYMSQHPFDNGHMYLRDEALAVWPRTEAVSQKELSDYYAIITHLDEQIGKVIASLKASGKYENTIIVLAGDSGLAVGNHGLMGKQNVYDEDGLHIPLIIGGGAIKTPQRKDALCYTHDIYPTICDLAKVKIPSSVIGKSLLPVINNQKDQIRDYTYHAYRQFQRAYRKGDYKLIEYVRAADFTKKEGDQVRGSRVTQLFNYKKDPWETQDLSFFPEYQEILKEMQSEIKEIAKKEDDYKEKVGYGFDFWDYYNPTLIVK